LILAKVEYRPKIAIVCGSGLGGLGDRVEKPIVIPYSTIPDFPSSTGKIFITFNFEQKKNTINI
jgi:purine nucleoside phosphorylase